MPKTVTTRWTLRALVVLAVVLVVQSTLAHVMALVGVGHTGRAWLTTSLTRDVPYLIEAEIAELRGRTIEIAADPAVIAAARTRDARTLSSALARLGPSARGWIFAADDTLLAAVQPACTEEVRLALASARPRVGSPALVCAGQALLVDAMPIADGIVFAYAVPIGDAVVDRIRSGSGAEVVMLVDGRPAHTSLLDADGMRTVPPDMVRELQVRGFDEIDVDFPDYAGFRMFADTERDFVGASDLAWFRATQPVQGSPRIAMLMLAPKPMLMTGVTYGLVTLVIGGLTALVVSALVLRKLVRSFSAPLDELVRSAGRVANGDFATPVAVMPGHEMTEFCTTYNQMLRRICELMRVRGALAREAGMAEVAVGVLHNVGNALNGVTAGAGLATERLGKMRLEPLERLAALLAEHRDDLPGFFAEGAAGQQVPAFVEELSRALHDDRVRLMDDLSSVKTASDHACAIVRAQQRYAKPVHVTESCNVDNVVEDALRIANIPSTIAVECTGGDVVAAVDRHRVMQIVVNLVTNAAEAIGEAPRGHIAVDVVDLVDRFEVLVADDGPGIPAEDRDRVFQFGFTTKRDGHGFGLHASSNSASEMDGRLELRHTEIGLGCQFALVLPKGKKLQRAA